MVSTKSVALFALVAMAGASSAFADKGEAAFGESGKALKSPKLKLDKHAKGEAVAGEALKVKPAKVRRFDGERRKKEGARRERGGRKKRREISWTTRKNQHSRFSPSLLLLLVFSPLFSTTGPRQEGQGRWRGRGRGPQDEVQACELIVLVLEREGSEREGGERERVFFFSKILLTIIVLSIPLLSQLFHRPRSPRRALARLPARP